MSSLLLISTIIAYILSLVLSIVLAAFSTKLKQVAFFYFSWLHTVLFMIAIAFYFLFPGSSFQQYSCLVAFCTGIIPSLWALRGKYIHKFSKVYFGIYLTSVIFFVTSPSALFYSISGNWKHFRKADEFLLKENCYLTEQTSMLQQNDEQVRYKIIKKYGIYNKTLARNVNFHSRLDSVKLLKFTDETIELRGFNGSDSIDQAIRPGMKSSITKKIKTSN